MPVKSIENFVNYTLKLVKELKNMLCPPAPLVKILYPIAAAAGT